MACLLLLVAHSSCGDEPVEQSELQGPGTPHDAPDESVQELCVQCHACGVDGAPIIDRAHAVCTECHGPAPDFVAQPKGGDGEGGCGWRMDCSATPPEVNCMDGCHDHTPRELNSMCEQCHPYVQAEEGGS